VRTSLPLVVCLLVPLPSAAAAQAGVSDSSKRATAVRVPQDAIRLDGRLNEPEWADAPIVADFVQKEPNEGLAPVEQTEVRFVYTNSALYVGARMHKQPGADLQAPMGRRDRAEQTEYFLLALDTFHDRRTAYVFGVTAAGVRLDWFHPRDDETVFDEGFNPVWEASTAVDELGWTAELRIPFSQLRFNPAQRQTWGLNAHRFIPTRTEHDYWVPVPRTTTGWASRFGELTGIEDLPPTRRIEILPYVAGESTVIGDPDPANPLDHGLNLRSHGGADLKIGLGPNLTLDATFNPDFGQVEADPAEVNLTAFETLFEEKRPFFTEGADLLNITGVTNFFYSRRIGAPPVGPAPADFVRYPRSSTIVAAAKVTGRLASGTSLGLLTALTGEEFARVATRQGPAVGRVRVAPPAAFALARVQQEFGRNQSTVSGMMTAVHRPLDSGDPLAAILARNAFTAAGETRLRFKDGEYELASFGGISTVRGEPGAIARVQQAPAHYAQRPDRDYARFEPARDALDGFKAGATLDRKSGRHWIWSLSTEHESPFFETNDIGRLIAADSHVYFADVRYRETVPGRIFRSYWIGASHNTEWSFGGNRQENLLTFYTNQVWRNFWTTELTHNFNPNRMSARLTRGGPLMETPRRRSTIFLIRNRTSARTSWSAELTAAATEDGGLTNQLKTTFSVRPGPRWQLSIDPTLFREVDTQQYLATLDGGRAETFGNRYVFATIDRSTYSAQFRLGYTFKPDLNLDVYAEPFAASGEYTNHGELKAAASRAIRIYGSDGTAAERQGDGSLLITDGAQRFTLHNADFNVRSFRSNVVLRWEYRPGSTLFVVWQQDRRVAEPVTGRIAFSDPFRSLNAPGNNYFVVKMSFWLAV
jgi:hypothetical protein